MLYSILGRTGRSVSRIGFGGAPAGIKNYTGVYDPRDEETCRQAVEAIRHAVALGINYFDTAASYGDGESERIFGLALRGIPPEKLFLATKSVPCTGKEFRINLEDSLRRLGRNDVDLMQVHGTSYQPHHMEMLFAPGGMLEEMERARDEGLIRYLGFSAEDQNAALYKLIHCGRFDVVQVEYNFLFQHPYDPFFRCGSLFDAAQEGLGIVAMRTATSGVFQKWIQQANPENTFDYTPALIQFSLSNPLVQVSLLGMRDSETVSANVALCDDLRGRMDLEALHRRISG